jgi:hypothetical protein
MANILPITNVVYSLARRHQEQVRSGADQSFDPTSILAIQRHSRGGGIYLKDIVLSRTVKLRSTPGTLPQTVAIFVEGQAREKHEELAEDETFDLAVLDRTVSPIERLEQDQAAQLSHSRGVNPKHVRVLELLGPVTGSNMLVAPLKSEVYIPLK